MNRINQIKYFIDTNVMYHISEIGINQGIDSLKLNKLLKTSRCVASIYSVYEILNNNHLFNDFRNEYKKIISFFNIIDFVADSSMNRILDISKWKMIENQSNEILKEELNKFRYYLSVLYASEFSFETSIVFRNYIDIICYYLKYINYPRTASINSYIKNLMESLQMQIKNLILEELMSLSDKNTFTEKYIKKIHKTLTANLINNFIPTINWFIEIMNKDEIPNYANLKRKLKDWFASVNLHDYLSDEIIEDYIDLMNFYKVNYIANKDSSLFYEINKKDYTDKFVNSAISSLALDREYYDYEMYYLKESIRSFFEGNFSIKPNNYVDRYILNLFMKTDSDIFLTFDKDMIKMMRSSKEAKIFNSLKVIDGLLLET